MTSVPNTAGRPTIYSEEIAATICERLANDESLISICADEDMPGLTTVYRWRRENEAFRQAYAHAREDQGHTAADVVGDIRRKVISGELDPQAGKAAADMAKWEASRRASKDFGDRIDLTSSDGTMSPPSLADFYGGGRGNADKG